MNKLTSVFAEEMREYLAVRQMTLTQRSFEIDRHVIGDFDAHIAGRGSPIKVVTEEIVNSWIQRLRNKNHSRTVSNKVSCLRGFLKYLRYCGVPIFMPQCPKYHEDYVPYIFSDIETAMIFRYADDMAAGGGNVGFEVAMLIRLLYGCGLRHAEALKLICGDKNKKQRIVPMHDSLTKMLLAYCGAMGIVDEPAAFLFPGASKDSPLSLSGVRYRFLAILKAADIYIPPQKAGERGQCVHCLRHVFAVKSFAQAERNGRTSADSVPYLSVYLGHFDMDGTEKYLRFSSDIFPEHTDMFEAYSTGVFSVLGGAE